MTKKTNSLLSDKLILSGDAAKDFSAFLKSKEKFQNFDFGVNLIKVYSKNARLYIRLKEIHKSNPDLALKHLIANLKVISYKWKK